MLRADHRFASAQNIHLPKWMLLLGAILLIVLSTLPLTAWAGDFPGKGSKAKWEEGGKYSTLGIEQAGKGDFPAAKTSFEKAISIYNQDPAFFHNLALAYEKMNRIELAEVNYRNAIRLDEKYGKSWVNLGHLYYSKNKYSDSLVAYKNAERCQLSETSRQNVNNIIVTLESTLASSRGKDLYKQGKYDKALVDLDRAVALDKENGEAYYLRSKVYKKLGKESNAQSDFARSKELDYKPKQGE